MIEFSLHWRSEAAVHIDRYFAGTIDIQRATFPGVALRHVYTLQPDETYAKSFDPGTLVPAFQKDAIIQFEGRQFEREHGGYAVTPRLGRFYPEAFAWAALNCPRGSDTPFRLIAMDRTRLVADTNHPLADYPLTLEAKGIEGLGYIDAQARRSRDIRELVTANGPGMQAPYPGTATDFYSAYPFRRRNENDDALFYESPRLVKHLDDEAVRQVELVYSRFLSCGSQILDLMSSWVSHLPHTLGDCETTGLGLNEEELRANRQLSRHIVHDLNQNPVLPFEDDAFDAVICTASIEYLTQPIEVIKEVARVTRAGGAIIATFSDRWFPGKEILPWAELHPFERLGLVLDYYVRAGGFQDLGTESVRGCPRPRDDRHIGTTTNSDPIFAVWGRVEG